MALSSNLSFQLGTTGTILNDDSVPNVPFIDVTRVSGLDNAPYRQTKRDHEGIDGGFMDAEFESGRDLILDGILYANNNPIEPILDSLKANFSPSKVLIPFYFLSSDVGTRFVMVKPLGVKYDWDDLRRIGCCTIQIAMYAEQPMIFDNVLVSTVMVIGATVFTGFGFSLGFSFGFGGTSTTADGVFVINGGNRATPPLLTIQGPATNPIIYNDTVSKNLSFNITLASTQTLVIDPYYRTVRLNGTTNRRSTLVNAGWFYLEPGNNFIKFRSTNGADTGFLTMAYRNAWR